MIQDIKPHVFDNHYIDIVNNSWHIFLKHSHTYTAISNES